MASYLSHPAADRSRKFREEPRPIHRTFLCQGQANSAHERHKAAIATMGGKKNVGENSKKAAGQARVCIPLFFILLFSFLLWAHLG